MVKGSGGAVGIAIGKAFVLPDWEWELTEQPIDVNDMPHRAKSSLRISCRRRAAARLCAAYSRRGS